MKDATHITFPCGCSIPINQGSPEHTGGKSLTFDPQSARLECKATWDLISRGETRGIFQLEKLGKKYSKEIRPENIHELAAEMSLIRPGCLQAKDEEGVSMTDRYIRRKHGVEEVVYIAASLEPILKTTYGVIVFQDQMMRIAAELCGFDLVEVDSLRKCVGKKDPIAMSAMKDFFINKAVESGHMNLEQATMVFSQIQKSQRYSLNSAHAYAYAHIAYYSAYIKAHSLYFYCGQLALAKNEPKPHIKIKEMVNDAKNFGVSITPPSFLNLNPEFQQYGDTVIFGIGEIKGIGGSSIKKLLTGVQEAESDLGPRKDWTWYQFLTRFSDRTSTTVVTRLIEVGALRAYAPCRQKMLAEFQAWESLTDKEKETVRGLAEPLMAKPKKAKPKKSQKSEKVSDFDEQIVQDPSFTTVDLADALDHVLTHRPAGVTTKRRDKVSSLVATLRNPPRKLEDTIDWTAKVEEAYLGVAISCSRIQNADKSMVNCTVDSFMRGRYADPWYIVLAVEITNVREIAVKNGPNAGATMAFLSAQDETGSTEDIVIFSEAYASYGGALCENATVVIQCKKDDKKGSLIVEQVWRA